MYIKKVKTQSAADCVDNKITTKVVGLYFNASHNLFMAAATAPNHPLNMEYIAGRVDLN